MDDEQLWQPPPAPKNKEDDDELPELFNAQQWRRDVNDADDEQLAEHGYPLFVPKPGEWKCEYGCPGLQMPSGEQVHKWNCHYWTVYRDDCPF